MPIAATRAPCSISMRRSSRPPRRWPRRRRWRRSTASTSTACATATSRWTRNCRRRRRARLAGAAGPRSRRRRGRGRLAVRRPPERRLAPPLQLNAKLSGGGLDADAQGSVELSAGAEGQREFARAQCQSGAAVRDQPGRQISAERHLSSRVGFAGNRLTFDDLDSTAAGSHLRGHLAMTLDQEKAVDGEVGLDSLDPCARVSRSPSARRT